MVDNFLELASTKLGIPQLRLDLMYLQLEITIAPSEGGGGGGANDKGGADGGDDGEKGKGGNDDETTSTQPVW